MELRYLLKNSKGEYFSSITFGKTLDIPVIFGCEQFESYEEAKAMIDSSDLLSSYTIVSRCTDVTVVDSSGENWRDKVSAELSFLEEKIGNLSKYLEREDARQRELLEKQLEYMKSYRDVLVERLK